MLHAAAGGNVRGCFEQENDTKFVLRRSATSSKAHSRITLSCSCVNVTLNSERKSEIRTVGSTHTFQQRYCLIDCGDSLGVSVALVQS
jgi:hypothetical protein